MGGQTTESHFTNAKGLPYQLPQSTATHHNITPRTRSRIDLWIGFSQCVNGFFFNERHVAGFPVAAALRFMHGIKAVSFYASSWH
jgi:hypothetical protein